ncbi:hypothetical protein [Rubritalea tangerina]|uniref:Uncharacterized protein n=1 Tax=Rubritalea tangerina TaxID=430798 RepID=A0ABW4ZGS5_9BACT
MRLLILCTTLLSSLALIGCHASPPSYPEELGPAKFHRDLTQATQLSKQSNKPIFALFQEVPG